MSWYVAFRQFLQPYYVPRPKPEKKQKKSKGKDTDSKDSSPPEVSSVKAPSVPVIKKDPLKTYDRFQLMDSKKWRSVKGIYVNTLDEPLGEIWDKDKLPYPNHAWYYHDDRLHELFTHIIPGSSGHFRDRNDAHRKKLKPLIYPIQDKPFDRTHLIPFGYHGVEDDNRLLIGWDSAQNQGGMNTFEQRQKRRPYPLYWLARVERTETGATLTYKVFRARDMALVDEQEFKMDGEFFWRAG